MHGSSRPADLKSGVDSSSSWLSLGEFHLRFNVLEGSERLLEPPFELPDSRSPAGGSAA